MERKEILDIFYNHIIPEAGKGKVDCYFMYNVIFNTRIPQKNLEVMTENDNPNLIVPTLYIGDCKKFEQLLIEYVNKALAFYDDSNFCEEVLNSKDLLGDDFLNQGKGVSKEKTIMTLLWSNATVEDFYDPCSFLRKRIDYFDLGVLEEYKNSKVVGYSEIIDADIECVIEKSKIESETPYYLQIFLVNPVDGERIYEFPRIYFGIRNDIVDIYAIQNSRIRLVNEKYGKKLERKMYKVNDGLDVKEDTYENYGFANLKDVTPSFLLTANIMTGLLKAHGINNLNVISILVSRWNAKNLLQKAKDEYVNTIQANLTDKLLRTFRRVGYHHSSVGIVSYPMEVNSNLIMRLYDQDDVCNNKLLEETFSIDKTKILKK